MNTITVLFTRRTWNPVSWLIRWAVPRSRFALGLSSHCLIDAGVAMYEANMLHGVRCVPRDVALNGLTIVRQVAYQVPDAMAGYKWASEQVGAPYDWPGALGLGLTPDRDWKQDDKWFCYEYAAGVIQAAGRPVFANLTHVGETALMAINP
jgi:hypothetical protein